MAAAPHTARELPTWANRNCDKRRDPAMRSSGLDAVSRMWIWGGVVGAQERCSTGATEREPHQGLVCCKQLWSEEHAAVSGIVVLTVMQQLSICFSGYHDVPGLDRIRQ